MFRLSRYSLQSLFVCLTIGTGFLALNLHPATTTSDLFTTLHDPAGDFGPMHDVLSLRRGFPFRYQQTEIWFQHGTVTDAFVREWQDDVGIQVTQPFYLAINVAVGVFLTMRANKLLAC